MTVESLDGPTLAACQKHATAPMRAGIAARIVSEVARSAQTTSAPDGRHGNISPATIVVRYDGTVDLLALESEGANARIGSASPSKLAYLAPEEIRGAPADRRADVFSLGVVLWELLTATRLFERESAMSTRTAILEEPLLDVRDVNPDVPALIGEVLGAALQRNPNARFDTVHAFARALEAALLSSELPPASSHDLARWVEGRVPRPARAAASSSVPDLDIPGTSRAHRSVPRMQAVQAPIPSFDVNALAAAALAPPSSPRISVASAPPAAPKALAFTPSEEDDFDMEIERNLTGPTASMPTATSSRPSFASEPRPSGGHRAAGTGLELAAPSRMKREEAARADSRADGYEPSIGVKIAGYALAAPITAGTAFALWKYMHRTVAGRFDPASLLPHAFDGSSAPESGAVSLVALVAAVTLGYFGLKSKPHSWALVASGGAMLLFALAMVTVTLASSGENPTPPDGALLVPYLFPAALLLLALGVSARAATMFARGGIVRRIAFVPVAAIAGAVAFLAFEASRFGH